MEREIPSYRRWTIVAAGVVIMFVLGTVYAWSVFKNPLMARHHWPAGQVTAAFELAILFLGISAACGGRLVDRAGARRVAMVAAALFGLGTALAGVADALASRWILWLGYGVVGGIGNGLGYIIPIAVLVRWFPEKKGLVTGLAVMGFGLGAAVMGKTAPALIVSLGIAKTFYLCGALFFVVLIAAASRLSNPPADWAPPLPAGPRRAPAEAAVTTDFAGASRMPQFYALWLILFINIAAGIALISNLSPLAQSQVGLGAAQAGTLVFVCSLFNGLGRLFWATVSDRIGRREAFLLILGTQVPLFFILPRVGNAALFCAIASYIFMCYGGGFAVMPSFAAETFGARNIGQIYGKILLAWGVAGIVGPLNMEYSGSFTRALALSGGALAAGLALVVCYRKPRPRQAAPLRTEAPGRMSGLVKI